MLNNENSIEVRNVSKSFKVYFDKGNELKEKMLFWKRNRYENRVVLNNISFTVKKGEAVGLIGRNGCGKSTTLKLLTKIIQTAVLLKCAEEFQVFLNLEQDSTLT